MKRDVDFYWNKQQQRSFDELKELCCRTPVLAYYDVTKDVTIQCDASSYGLVGVLLQDGRPTAYTSRALTPTEKKYVQLEKEMLAIVHNYKKFHYYIFGKPTTVESDHKPLQAICAKPLLSAPTRLQAMLLRLQPYDLDVTYKPGKSLESNARTTGIAPNDLRPRPVSPVCQQTPEMVVARPGPGRSQLTGTAGSKCTH